MSNKYRNGYRPRVSLTHQELHAHDHAVMETYDHNFCLEVRLLKSDKVELRPLVVSRSGRDHLWHQPASDFQAFWDEYNRPDSNKTKITRFQRFSWETLADLTERLEVHRRDPVWRLPHEQQQTD